MKADQGMSVCRHITRDQVLIAHAHEMITRTSCSQDGFAQALAAQLYEQSPELAAERSVPDFEAMARTNDTTTFVRASGAWLRKVGRWLAGDVDLPAWIEEAWVQALELPFQERCMNELAARHGLTGARQVAELPCPLTAFGQLVSRLGSAVSVGSEVLEDGVIDHHDRALLPQFIDQLRSVEARAGELRLQAEQFVMSVAEG